MLSHHLLQFGQLREVQLEPQVQQQGQLLRQEPACPLLPQAAPAAVHSPCPDQVQDLAAGADQAVLDLQRLLLLRQHLRLQPEVMQLLLQVLYVVLRVLSGLHSACWLPAEGTVRVPDCCNCCCWVEGLKSGCGCGCCYPSCRYNRRLKVAVACMLR